MERKINSIYISSNDLRLGTYITNLKGSKSFDQGKDYFIEALFNNNEDYIKRNKPGYYRWCEDKAFDESVKLNNNHHLYEDYYSLVFRRLTHFNKVKEIFDRVFSEDRLLKESSRFEYTNHQILVAEPNLSLIHREDCRKKLENMMGFVLFRDITEYKAGKVPQIIGESVQDFLVYIASNKGKSLKLRVNFSHLTDDTVD